MNNELITLLEYIEQERGIDRDTMVAVLEEALVSAARKSVDQPADDLDVKFEKDTGEYKVFAKLKVVESNSETCPNCIDLEKAMTRNPGVAVGDVIDWEMTPGNFGRIAAQAAKQAMMQKIRRAEKEVVHDEFREMIDQIVNGVVRRYEAGNVIVDMGKAEGILSFKDRIPGENYMPGDRINALLIKIDQQGSGPSLVLSRTNKKFVGKLFEREVSEIHDEIVEIKGLAREPGSRTKIAVASKDEHVDAIGACVGMRGSRVKSITTELGGEKIDIVEYSDDVYKYVANALQPAKLAKIEILENERTINIKVDKDQLSLAIGKRGQNVRLTSKLLGHKVNILQVEEVAQASFEEKLKQMVDALSESLHLPSELIEKLVKNGFTSIEGIREVEPAELLELDDFTQEEVDSIIEALDKAE
ncbi:MAG: transcription termination factor NusA [Kiritimatiellaeota bacterium]|nr:transcription termination factor NusA [Kiritimatiellota bacterium]